MLKCLGVVGLFILAPSLWAQGTPQPGVFVQPYPVCRDVVHNGESQKLCVNASIAASTLEGRSFAEDSDCSTVKTQRPYRPLPTTKQGKADDPRLQDSAFMADLDWVKSQVRASACSCCHSTAAAPTYAAWDIDAPYVWIEQMTDRAVAIMAGSLPTDLMGSYSKEQNFGFDRSQTGSPTTDVPRMKTFFQNELDRRGVTEEAIAKMQSGNGPFEQVLKQKPIVCPDGIGVDSSGRVSWGTAAARYVYITSPEASNPLTPPNTDLPAGTLWRLDVLPSSDPLASGVSYGSRLEGTLQKFPSEGEPEALQAGQTYRLYATRDVLRPIINCTFVYRAAANSR